MLVKCGSCEKFFDWNSNKITVSAHQNEMYFKCIDCHNEWQKTLKEMFDK